MRYLAVLASAAFVAGSPDGVRAEDKGIFNDGWKLDAGFMTSIGRLSDYSLGDGVGAGVAYEKTIGQAVTRFGIRGSALDYELNDENFSLPEDFQEYSLGLEALVGLVATYFESKMGGHIGYTRQDGAGSIPDLDILDVGLDLMGSMDITPKWGLQAVLSPAWLISEDDKDYRTRVALNIEFTIPRG